MKDIQSARTQYALDQKRRNQILKEKKKSCRRVKKFGNPKMGNEITIALDPNADGGDSGDIYWLCHDCNKTYDAER